MQKRNNEKPVQCFSVFTLFSLELIKAGDPDQTWRPHSSHLENASLGLSTCHFFVLPPFRVSACKCLGQGTYAEDWTWGSSSGLDYQTGSYGKWSAQFSLAVHDSKFWFLGIMRKWIIDPRSLGSQRIKGTDKYNLGKGFSVPLMHLDPSYLGSMIRFRIFP